MGELPSTTEGWRQKWGPVEQVKDTAPLVRELRRLHGAGDAEIAHSDADRLLLDFIGCPLVREAFEAVPRWYA